MNRALVLALLLLGSCAGPSAPPPQSYVLLPPRVTPRLVADGPVLRFGRVELAAHVRGVTFIRPDGRADTAVYHQWAAPPQETVTEWLRGSLLGSGVFSAVNGPRSTLPADLVLDLDILRMDVETDDDGAFSSVLEIELQLSALSRRTPLLTQRVQMRTPGEGAGIEGVIAAFRKGLKELVPTASEAIVAAARNFGNPPER